MNACGPACGYCGRCTSGPGKSGERLEQRLPTCDQCGEPILSGGVSYVGVGTFCGHKCKVLAIHARDARRKSA